MDSEHTYALPERLRFGPDEAEKLVEAVSQSDVDLNTFCRQAILEAIEWELIPDED